MLLAYRQLYECFMKELRYERVAYRQSYECFMQELRHADDCLSSRAALTSKRVLLPFTQFSVLHLVQLTTSLYIRLCKASCCLSC